MIRPPVVEKKDKRPIVCELNLVVIGGFGRFMVEKYEEYIILR